MELNTILSVLLYVVCIILLVVLIILGIRLIQLLKKVDRIVDNVEEKVNLLNGTFELVNKATNTISMIGDSFVNTVTSLVTKVFRRKNKNKEDFYE